ncbi:hypothetical protein H9655_14120 [Cytobacillus sp. Sa5YUA1]|uniref:Uncharacterized protein n=1 Tax=Cytobacillus stercorigallinarum TaxID=2762240 RepID=A0ABR8QRL3_9BACI|nr:hypothetical protein [Cytobacillus stercorigallinarum]MBD7938165.1 hypothetical protein [Cytobacillus stercorigallinarum]
MRWKLRIPLILLTMGLTSKLFQLFIGNGSFFNRLLYIFLTGGVIFLLERTGLNNQKVHFSFGVLIIFVGLSVDYFSI